MLRYTNIGLGLLLRQRHRLIEQPRAGIVLHDDGVFDSHIG